MPMTHPGRFRRLATAPLTAGVAIFTDGLVGSCKIIRGALNLNGAACRSRSAEPSSAAGPSGGGNPMLRSTLGRFLAAVVLAACISWMSTGTAGAAAPAEYGRFQCLGSQQLGVGAPINVTATNYNYGQFEIVRWHPTLYRFNGTNWVLFDDSKPWYRGFANQYGMRAYDGFHFWWDEQTTQPLYRVTYNNLPAGQYAALGTVAGSGSVWLAASGGSGAICTVVK